MSTFFETCGQSRGTVLANIFPVLGKDAGEDHGMWIAGPFDKETVDAVAQLTTNHLTKTGQSRDGVSMIKTEKGWHLLKWGPEVRAYGTDIDGLEVDQELMDDFVLDMVPPGHVVTFEGFHRLIDDKVFILHERAWHDGFIVRWSGTREVRKINGGRVVLRPPAEPMLMVA